MDLIERAAKQQKARKKGASLVERAAENVEKNPFAGKLAVGIGTPKKHQRDPSAMNPSVTTTEPVSRAPEKPRGANVAVGVQRATGLGQNATGLGQKATGLGQNTGPANTKNDEIAKTDVTKNADDGVSVARPSAAGLTGQDNAAATAPGVVRKVRKQRKVEEIDLVGLRESGYITPDMPPNLMLEEFRIIKRSILLNAFSKGTQKSKNSNIVLVTSSNPGEGKTFCTINLALSIATEQDTTVLLIDADFSKPEVLNRMGVGGGRGLMDVVADKDLEVGDCLIRTNVPNLVLLPAGRQHNLTTELLASDRMEAIVDEIANRYPDRLVIFDSPPVLASSAASVMALYMGQTVFVIHAEQTTEPQIKESLNMISSCEHINLLLNQTRFNGGNKKFATYYGYGGR
ncbi:MAG: protein tyrosine kinase [Kordiimonadales bacterium]|nr:MAG: protein tyrosine kinase [Kordiimonadales bacterium]